MVAILYPSDISSSGRFRKHSIYATVRGDHVSVRSGSFYGRGCGRGRGGRGCGGRGRLGIGGHGRGSSGGCSEAYKNGIEISYIILCATHSQKIQGKG